MNGREISETDEVIFGYLDRLLGRTRPDLPILNPASTSNTSSSVDPNAKTGATGVGSSSFINDSAIIPYRITFENVGPGSRDANGNPFSTIATAPAQSVTITDQLSSNLDWNSFRLGQLGFGSTIVPLPADSQSFDGDVKVTINGKTIDVVLRAGINLATGQVFASFQSIDPNTSLPPDVLVGFLPPEDGTGNGQGYFSYTVQPKAGLSTGTQIRNIALISFDGQTPIATDQVDDLNPAAGSDPARQALNTIDSGKPASGVDAMPPFSPASFLVQWAGADDPNGSGVGTYDVYVSDNGGPFTLWLGGTSLSQGVYTGEDGHTYGFYTRAHDNVQNLEDAPALADAQTTVDAAAPSSAISPLPAFATAQFTVSWSGQDDAGGSGLDSFDVFVSDNGSPFTSLLSDTTTTATPFTGTPGHTYAFYTISRDNVGNVEAAPAVPDAQIYIPIQPKLTLANAVVAPGNSAPGGSFADADPNDTWSATLDLHDGSGIHPLLLNPDKTFSISGLSPGTYSITVQITDSYGLQDSADATLVILPGPLSGTPEADTYTLRLDPTGTHTQFFLTNSTSGQPDFYIAHDLLNGLSFDLGDGDDSFVLDLSNGNPLPVAGLSLSGGAGKDLLKVIGSAGDDSLTLDASSISVGAFKLNLASDLEDLQVQDGSGSNALNVTGGSHSITADLGASGSGVSLSLSNDATVSFNTIQHLPSLSVAGSARVLLAKSHSTPLILGSLSLSDLAQVDLNDNDLIVSYTGSSPEDQLRQYVNNWLDSASGPKLLASSADDASSSFLRTLAVSDNANLKFTSFSGQSLSGFSQVLVKYTYLGDANLDGLVSPRDYAIIDGNVGLGHDWGSGDLNLDGQVSPADYAMIDGNVGAGNGAGGGPQLSILGSPGAQTPVPTGLAREALDAGDQAAVIAAAIRAVAGGHPSLFSDEPIHNKQDLLDLQEARVV